MVRPTRRVEDRGVPLTKSVPSPSAVQATYAATLVDEWVRRGLRDVVICPGSRSTPLAAAFFECDELRLHVRIDERSAGFFALGRALASRRPVAVLVTSGTAAAELHACVAEADHAEVPLILITADRPPELHGVGAPQTINQRHLYGEMVRCFDEPGVAKESDAASWRALARRLYVEARGAGGRPGPVHLNAAFIEPLLANALELPALDAVAELDATEVTPGPWRAPGSKILAIVGRGTPSTWVDQARAHHWVVVGDATTNATLAHADALLRSIDFARRARPDVVVRLGGLPASKVLLECWRSWDVTTVGFLGAGFLADPERLISERVEGFPAMSASCVGDAAYAQLWLDASGRTEAWLEGHEETFSEPTLARCVVKVANETGTPLVLGSSMPVRDVEWWAPTRHVLTYSNRGVSGIDGVVSTALGVASGAKALALVGDVTMLHDVSALVDGIGPHGGTLVLVVANNHGGGIFSFLSQADLDHDQFETLFATPRPHNLERIVESFGYPALSVTSIGDLRVALDKALATSGLSVVVADLPSRDDNVALHRAWNDSVVKLLEVTP